MSMTHAEIKAHADRLIANRKVQRTVCPICGHVGTWCRVDEHAVLCARSNGDGAVRKFGEYGWLHILNGTTTVAEPSKTEPAIRLTDAECHTRFAPLARSMWRNQSEQVGRLAKQLGVATWTLDALRIGYGDYKGVWSYVIPEMNHNGLIVGLSRRFADGSKRCVTGSRRGLVYAENWSDYPGPVVIVEGASDAAALLTLGICVVGRPSNVGGCKMLIGLLGTQPKDRQVVVIGERDRKKHEDLAEVVREKHKRACSGCSLCWPGKHGATSTAAKLRKGLALCVRWAMCPDGAKDPRAWLNARGIDVESRLQTSVARVEFLTKIGWRYVR